MKTEKRMVEKKKLVKKPATKFNTVKAYGCRACNCAKGTTKSNQKGFDNLCNS